jgi:drug/metabolite transporter (DMT)-like permease
LNENKLYPVAALVFGATAWGVIWYPYRLLDAAGVGGEVATLVTYLLALVATTLAFPRAWGEFPRAPIALGVVALAAGWCNLAYVLGMLRGEVMRVLLLFYLAPLWTVPLARFILQENVNRSGYFVVLLAFSGALVMLWNPAWGLPVPATAAEWLGLSAGFCFALANVIVRKAANCGVVIKTQSVFLGVILVSLVALVFSPARALSFPVTTRTVWLSVALGATLMGMSLAVQYGLSHVSATRAIVILLFELVVAAIASYLLSGEVMRVQEWVGGAMIVAASLFSGQIEHTAAARERAPATG